VQGHEPLHLQRDPGRLRRRRGSGRSGRRPGTASRQIRFGRRHRL
jgi:hypothetical protein